MNTGPTGYTITTNTTRDTITFTANDTTETESIKRVVEKEGLLLKETRVIVTKGN